MWFNPVILVRKCKFWSHPWQIRAHWTCTAQFQQVDLSFDLGPKAWAVPSSMLHCQSQTHEDRGRSYTPLKFWKSWKSDQQESKEVLFDLFGGNLFPYELQKNTRVQARRPFQDAVGETGENSLSDWNRQAKIRMMDLLDESQMGTPWCKWWDHMGMDQYLLIPFLGEWTSIYQLFWCSPGVQGFDTLPYQCQPKIWSNVKTLKNDAEGIPWAPDAAFPEQDALFQDGSQSKGESLPTIADLKKIYGFVWKCWVNIPNEIAI